MDIDRNPDWGKVLDQEMAYGYSLGLHNIMVAAQATQVCMTPVGFTIETYLSPQFWYLLNAYHS